MTQKNPPPSESRRASSRWFAKLWDRAWTGKSVTIRLHFCHSAELAPLVSRIIRRLKSNYPGIEITTSEANNAMLAIRNSHLVFIVINRNWLESSQVNSPSGSIYTQLEFALSLAPLPVVPLLIGEADMPSQAQLGSSLGPLADRNFLRVDPGRSFEQNMEQLFEGINMHFQGVPIRLASTTSSSGFLVRIARVADRLWPIAIPPEYYRGSPVFFSVALAVLTFLVVGVLVMAIAEREFWLLLLPGFLGLVFGRVALFMLRELFAAEYFQGKPEIFLSYRRADTEGMAGEIYEVLKHEFGSQKVFMDVGGCIQIGANFFDYLDHQIRSSRIVVFLIGSDWIGERVDESPRIFDTRDFLRIEIESALKSSKETVLVLLDRESPPKASELPDSIRAICKQRPIIVHSGPSFDDDMRTLETELHKILKAARPSLVERWMQPSEGELESPWWGRVLKHGAGTLMGVGFIAFMSRAKLGSRALDQQIAAGAIAAFIALLTFLAFGKVVGALRECWSRSKGTQAEP